jgi:hypothetical protein
MQVVQEELKANASHILVWLCTLSNASMLGLLLTWSMLGQSKWAGLTYIGWQEIRVGWWLGA